MRNIYGHSWVRTVIAISINVGLILLIGNMAMVLLNDGVMLLGEDSEAEAARPAGTYGKDWGDPKGQECVLCHRKHTPGLYGEWNKSQHGQSGVNCLDCHKAEGSDKDAFRHKGQLISVIVTPKDCARCHTTEFEEMDGSHHAKAAEILASLDNLLGEVVGGPAAINAGCRQCHGSIIEIGEDGKPLPTTWPNTGIGRINPDGSKESCTAYHGRHRFSKAQARPPSTKPTEVGRAIVQTNRQLNLMLQRRFSPSDVLQQVSWGLEYAKALLAQFPGVTPSAAPPPFQRGKQPADVFLRLVECFVHVEKIAHLSGMAVLHLDVEAAKQAVRDFDIQPCDVYDLATLLISDLTYLYGKLKDAPPIPSVPFPGRKFPSHVYQQAGVLLGQLHELEEQVRANPTWTHQPASAK